MVNPQGVTVVIPVGPLPVHRRWLGECLDSVWLQSSPPDEILLIDDMADLASQELHPSLLPSTRVWRAPWRLGVADAFNAGIAVAQNEWCFMLGADDTLDPDCIAECKRAISADASKGHRYDRTWYYVGVKYSDGREQNIACAASMVSRSLWQHTGGFPPEAGVGASDAALLSVLIGNGERAGRIVPVNEYRTLYNHRVHDQQDTHLQGAYSGIIVEIRNILTASWQRPEWGRFEP